MSVYHQMGDKSRNLLDLPDLGAFKGAILSPVNETLESAERHISETKDSRENFEMILDPQLFVPASTRGSLPGWPYYPSDIETADQATLGWWKGLNSNVAATCSKLGVDAVCSPAVFPKEFSDDYYSLMAKVADDLVTKLPSTTVLQTVLVNLPAMANESRPLEIASIVSDSNVKSVYLLLSGAPNPRRELSDVDELSGVMKCIHALEGSGIRVLVGSCSSDLILWKAAGATHCSTGKHFKLRRFTLARWEEAGESGGGQLAYWFEQNLLAFLRQGDVLGVRELGLLSSQSMDNPFGQQILQELDDARSGGRPPNAWIALGWRHYLYQFADLEGRLARGVTSARELLRNADQNWTTLDKNNFFLEERQNDGAWIRSWLNSIRKFELTL